MLIFKAVQKFIGNKTRRTRPDEDAHELDCMPPIKKATNYYLEFSLHIKTKTWLFSSSSHCFDVSSYQWRITELSIWTLFNKCFNLLKKYFYTDVIIAHDLADYVLCDNLSRFVLRLIRAELCIWTVKKIKIHNKDTRGYFGGSAELREAHNIFLT